MTALQRLIQHLEQIEDNYVDIWSTMKRLQIKRIDLRVPHELLEPLRQPKAYLLEHLKFIQSKRL